MPTFNRAQAPDVFDTRPLWMALLVYKQNPKSYTEVFYVSPEKAAFVDVVEFSGLGRFRSKPEGTPITYDVPVQGQRRRVVHATYALGTAFTHEALSDAQTSSNGVSALDKQSVSLTRSQLDHEERLAWDLLRGSFTTTTGIDGVAVISAAHPYLKPPSPGALRTNRLDPHIPVSYEGVEAMSILFLNQQSTEGHYIGNDLKGAMIVAHTNKTHIVNNILDAKGRPDSTNTFDTNQVSKMGLKPVTSPYLGTTAPEFEAWWMVGKKGSRNEAGNGWQFNDREGFKIRNSVDSDTGDKKWGGWYRASGFNRQWEGNAGSSL